MIELRFVDRTIQVDGATEMKTRALQYRYRYPYRHDDTRAYPPEEWHWSDWQDVPVVTEE